jgi:hypothetical protein
VSRAGWFLFTAGLTVYGIVVLLGIVVFLLTAETEPLAGVILLGVSAPWSWALLWATEALGLAPSRGPWAYVWVIGGALTGVAINAYLFWLIVRLVAGTGRLDPISGSTVGHRASAIDSTLVKKFRDQMHALGALWIILGSVRVGLSLVALVSKANLSQWSGIDHPAFWTVLGVIGLIDFAIGVLTCLKHVWAVYVGLALTYLSLLSLNLCAMPIVLIVIFQAHRVIGWARQMRAAGMPLTAKPQ